MIICDTCDNFCEEYFPIESGPSLHGQHVEEVHPVVREKSVGFLAKLCLLLAVKGTGLDAKGARCNCLDAQLLGHVAQVYGGLSDCGLGKFLR